MLSRQSVERATGLSNYTVEKYMSDDGKLLQSCYIYAKPRTGNAYRLKIRIDDPSQLPLSRLEGSRASRNGADLPTNVGPGFTFTLMESGEKYGTDGWAWAQDGSRMLSVSLSNTPSNRDAQKDVIEFIRQLRPIVLDED
ncbi:hypothetical protein AB0J35_56410 [Nonomuraea angiospora]|uniref:hypothetical protein n=1 Tax=Nonomuraea angiospora TaxID=46172 RepID=UPI00342BC8F5